MPTPTMTPGAPCWIDLLTTNPDGARTFYTELFGWTYEVGDQEKYGGYITAFKDGRAVAGMMGNDPQAGFPDSWSTYLRVDDADATAAAVTDAGVQIFMGPMDIPEQGRMAMIADAGGAAIGLWQFGGHTGFQVAAVPGAPAWHELFTRDYRATVKFYRDVFGWDTDVMSDTDEFRYTTLGTGRDAQAGIMDASAFLPEGIPAHWRVHFGVDSTDAASDTTVAMGGRVVDPAQNTPYGRCATLADPAGATFLVIENNLGE